MPARRAPGVSRVPGLHGDTVLVHRAATFAPDLASAGQARRLLLAALDDAGRPQWADAGALALSEVVTNAALHAHTAFEVLVEVRADRLWVEVRDGNPTLPRRRQYGAQATTGRGMAMVAALTDECGVHSLGSDGKVVWFSLSDPAPEQSADDLLNAWDLDGDWDHVEKTTPTASATQPVTLLAMPTTLWLGALQHHDALLRELVLYLAQHDDVQVDLALADTARRLVSGAVQRAVDEAQPAGPVRPPDLRGPHPPLPPAPDSLTLTVSVSVPANSAASYTALQDTLDLGERLAAADQLLVRPALPEIVAVRDWVCEQVVAQLAGVPASPWPGTQHWHGDVSARSPEDDDAAWDDGLVRDADRGVVAVNDANRIVAISRPLADLLGWDVDDLLGRRVVTLVPPRLRDAHIAGFTRHLATGEARILGVPLVLPVLHADGRELPCRFLLERAPQRGRRSLYLSWIEALPED